MNRKLIAATAVAALTLVLTGCLETGEPGDLKTHCAGPDKVFLYDDANNGTELFVAPNHPECTK